MEAWQLNHIKSYLPQLLANTDCNVSLLSILKSKDILSPEETENIQKTQTRHAKAECLYKIAETRINSYNILLSALVETNQSGAHKILNAHFIPYDKIISLEYQKDKPLGNNSGDFVFYPGKFGERKAAIRRELYIGNSGNVNSQIIEEIRLLTKLDCQENILRFFTCKIDDDLQHILVAFEYCSSTLEKLVCNENQLLDTVSKVSILKQLTSALCFLHSHNIIYLNLRPSSILISENLQYKLRPKFSKFRSATYWSPDGISKVSSERLSKNIDWLPGYIQSSVSKKLKEINVNPTVDIFSLGCVFHYVWFSVHPFGDLFYRNISMMKNEPYKYPIHETICEDIIKKMIMQHNTDNNGDADDNATLLLDNVISDLKQL